MWRTKLLALTAVAAVGVAASPPACRAGLGLFRVGKPQPSQARLHAADGFFAAELARRAPAVAIHDHGPLFFHF